MHNELSAGSLGPGLIGGCQVLNISGGTQGLAKFGNGRVSSCVCEVFRESKPPEPESETEGVTGVLSNLRSSPWFIGILRLRRRFLGELGITIYEHKNVI